MGGNMVKRMPGLKQGPRAPPTFGGESGRPAAPLGPGSAVRCGQGDQEIYVGVLGVSADGWLLGQVLAFGESRRFDSLEAQPGDLVEIRTDRVLAVGEGRDIPVTASRARGTASAPALPQ
jgi:hypothetical protein